MRSTKKYYFRRVETAVVQADSEDEARDLLGQYYTVTEDFELDNIIHGVDIDGVFVPTQENA